MSLQTWGNMGKCEFKHQTFTYSSVGGVCLFCFFILFLFSLGGTLVTLFQWPVISKAAHQNVTKSILIYPLQILKSYVDQTKQCSKALSCEADTHINESC